MKYQPSLPERNDNISHEQPVRELFILIAGVVLLVAVVVWGLGLFVDIAVDAISPETEVELFAKVEPSWFLDGDRMPDEEPALQTLIDALGACRRLPFSTPVFVVDDPMINAMALPGGRIVVFSGLLKQLETQNGLAFVLAHELGHFTNRDHLRSMGRGLVLTALVSTLTGAGSDLSQFVASWVGLGVAKYSQSRESLADETGLEILNCHYGHVGGATELFEVLKEQADGNDLRILHYFDSHPELQQRIAAILQLAQDRGYTTGSTISWP